MIKKIPAADLCVGMFLQGLCGPWTQHPFWRTKFVIRDTREIGQIIDSGITEVLIDATKGVDAPAPASHQDTDDVAEGFRRDSLARTMGLNILGQAESVPTESAPASKAAASTPAPVRQARLEDEIHRATEICKSANHAVTAMFQEARMGKAISTAAAGVLVDEIAASVARNPGALISLARLKTADDYTYMHSVAVCGLMVALAGQLGLDAAQTRDAGMAGLLHDVGKMAVSLAILNKPGKLTDEEFRSVRAHPEQGHQMLVEGGNSSPAVLDVCLHHHEKLDGTGYPHRLAGEQISQIARMGAICDVYDAITSNRAYKAGWDPGESIRKMSEWCGPHLDLRIFQAFVKSVGIYPTGSLVRLASGRLAVVLDQSRQSLLSPTVKVFFSTKSRCYIAPEVIDLARSQADRIVGAENATAWGIKNLDQFWTA